MDGKPSLKEPWFGHVNYLNFVGHQPYICNGWSSQVLWYTGDGLSDQFIKLTADICVQHGGREALRRAGLSAAAESCWDMWQTDIETLWSKYLALLPGKMQRTAVASGAEY